MKKEFMSNRERMENWRVQSPDEAGLFEVISPTKSDCSSIYIYRLNLNKGNSICIKRENLELNGVIIQGSVRIRTEKLDCELSKLDSFFMSANIEIRLTATDDTVLYIAGAEGEKNSHQSIRKFDITLPIGDIHQIHGKGVGEREVMFTCDPKMSSSRLLCGLTWSRCGTWTSWPPHQHEQDLEEVYCYFDMDPPKMGLHISYLKSGEREDLVAHPVRSGTMVLAPCGYHPTVAMPGTVNAYFWALSAFAPEKRRYDLAITDPELVNEN